MNLHVDNDNDDDQKSIKSNKIESLISSLRFFDILQVEKKENLEFAEKFKFYVRV